jgi:hypothetical protein
MLFNAEVGVVLVMFTGAVWQPPRGRNKANCVLVRNGLRFLTALSEEIVSMFSDTMWR